MAVQTIKPMDKNKTKFENNAIPDDVKKSHYASGNSGNNGRYEVEEYDFNDELTTQDDFNTEDSISFDNFAVTLSNMGINEQDINRVLNGEISLNDLLIEIDKDPDRKRKTLEYLSVQNLLSQLEEIDPNYKLNENITNLDDLKAYMEKLQLEYDSLSKEIDSFQEITSFNKILEFLENGNDLDSALDTVKAAYVYTDREGNKHYVYDQPIGTIQQDQFQIGKYFIIGQDGRTYESLTYREMYGESDLVKELRSNLTKNDPSFLGKTFLGQKGEIYKIDKNNYEQKQYLSNLKDKINKSINEQDEKEAKLYNLSSELGICDYVYTEVTEGIDYYMESINPYVMQDNFIENAEFNFDSLTNLNDIISYYNNPNYNNGIEGIEKIIINDKKDKVDIISCIINGQGNITNGYISLQTQTFQLDSFDDLIQNYAKWAPLMTDQEKEVFNYVYNTDTTENKENTYQYLTQIANRMDKIWLETQTQKDEQFAKEHHFLSSVGSVFVTPFEGMSALCYSLKQYGLEAFNKDDETRQIFRTNVYSAGNVWRSAVAQDIAKEHGEFASFTYSTGMSMADSLMLIATSYATGGGSLALSAGIMGSRAYVSTLNECLDKGYSDGRSVALAFASATVETLMEHKSLGHLMHLEEKLGSSSINLIKNMTSGIANPKTAKLAEGFLYVVANQVSQGIAEGEEELATEIANSVCDLLWSKGDNDITRSLEYYKSQGYTDDEAIYNTVKDYKSRLEQAFIGGFASGVCFGTFSGVKSTINTSYGLSQGMYENNSSFIDAIQTNQEQMNLLEDTLKDLKNKKIIKSPGDLNTELINKLVSEQSISKEAGEILLTGTTESQASKLFLYNLFHNNLNIKTQEQTQTQVQEQTNEENTNKHKKTKAPRFSLERINNEVKEYKEICDELFKKVNDERSQTILKSILYDGEYNGYTFNTEKSNIDNCDIEANRRISMAVLYITNPQTFKYIASNNINIFHGTDIRALPSILQYGIKSCYNAEQDNIEITTGEATTRIKGNPRNFISFTDNFEVAQYYSSADQNGIIIGTDVDNIQSKLTNPHSDTPEIGIRGSMPIEDIKVVFTSLENVEKVKEMVKGTNIDVYVIDNTIEKIAYNNNNVYEYDFNEIKNIKVNQNQDIDQIIRKSNASIEQRDIEIIQPKKMEKLETSDVGKFFDSQEMADYLKNLSTSDLVKILKEFRTASWLASNSITEIITNMNQNDLSLLLNGLGDYNYKIIKALNNNNSIANYIKILQTLQAKYYTEEYILNNIEEIEKIEKFLTTFDNNYKKIPELQQIEEEIEQKKNAIMQRVIDSMEISPTIKLYGTKIKINNRDGKYYKLIFEVNGEIKEMELSAGFSRLDIKDIIENQEYVYAAFEGNMKLIGLIPIEKKNNMVLKSNQGYVVGLNEITLNIDGKEKKFIIDIAEYENIEKDLNQIDEISKEIASAEKAEVKNIKSIGNLNISCTENDKLYLLTYDINGKKYEYYITPQKRSGEYYLDINKHITSNNLIGVENINVKELKGTELKGRFSSLDRYSSFTAIFNQIQYGGDQSNVFDIVKNRINGQEETTVEKIKAELLIKMIEKYFPNCTEIDKINLADHYANGGCGWMAIANAFATYMGDIENGQEIFREKMGYDLSFIEDGIEYYNLEAIAFDMYLSTYSKLTSGIIEDVFKSGGSGLNPKKFIELIPDFFASKGIVANAKTEYSTTQKNILFQNILNHKTEFNILTSQHFDLKVINGKEMTTSDSKDSSLSNSQADDFDVEDIDGHGMLITGIDDEGNIIVSSWSRKCQFVFESLDKYFSKYNGNLKEKPYANVWRINFSIPK